MAGLYITTRSAAARRLIISALKARTFYCLIQWLELT